MNTNIKRGIVTGAISLSLLGGSAAGVVAQNAGQGQQAGAGGLVAAVVQAQIDDTLNDVVDVNVVDSLNNLQALNNILNNSPILNGNDVDVVVQDISVLDPAQLEILTVQLEDSALTLDDVVGVSVLSGGDIIAFV